MLRPMWSDVVDLRDFYATRAGLAARRVVRARAREMWPDVRGQSILGLGYATPFLGAFRAEAERTVALMPSAQGVLSWPAEGPPLTALTKENALPLADLSVDRVILAHTVESAEHLRPLMREVWRVLAEGGRLMVIAPNRRGLWARFDFSPFGNGLPYSSGQLSRLLRDALFTPQRIEGALFAPPFGGRFVFSGALAWERFGRRAFPAFGGVLMAEAAKQVYAQTSAAKPARRRVLTPLPGGLSQASRAPNARGNAPDRA
ncbi:MAG: class I SAM-dependent methyltransferase [Rhodospirillales bacterium]